MNVNEIENILSGCNFFQGFDKKDIHKIAGLCKIKTYDAGAYVFEQGTLGEHLYIISRGRIFLERSVDMGTRKGSVVIETLGSGNLLGCWSTLLGRPHTLMSSATCKQTARIVEMKGSKLREMMLESTTIGFNVLEKLCFLLRDRIQAAYGALEKI